MILHVVYSHVIKFNCKGRLYIQLRIVISNTIECDFQNSLAGHYFVQIRKIGVRQLLILF